MVRKGAFLKSNDQSTTEPTNLQDNDKEPEILSLSAKSGRFDIFKNELVVRHLRIGDVDCFHIMDIKSGRWITHLKTSPPINVTVEGMIHIKKVDVEVTVNEIIEIIARNQSSRFTHANSTTTPGERKVGKRVIDLTNFESPMAKKQKVIKREIESASAGIATYNSASTGSVSPPTASQMETEGFEIVGSRPAKLSVFPAKTVKEMTSRLNWIVSNKTLGTLDQRFQKVFSCEFKESTYHRHRRAWKHMMNASMLDNKEGTDLWGPLVQVAEVAMKEN